MTVRARGRYHLSEVDLNVTRRCNLGCAFCSVLVTPLSDRTEELSLARIRGLFAEFDQLGVERVRLVGGEPFIRRDIADVLKLSRDFEFRTTVLTNGTMMTAEHVDLIRQCDIEFVAFSIDGPTAAVHDESRGQLRSFERAIRTIARCTEAGVRHRMMTAVTAASVQRMKELVLFAEEHKFEAINFILLGLSGLAVTNRHHFPTYKAWAEAIVDLSLFLHGQPRAVWVSLLFPHEDPVPIELYDPLSKAGHLPLLTDVWLIDYRSFDRTALAGRARCEAGHNSVSIMPNGDVFGCDLMQNLPEFRAGNIYEESLDAIFHRSPVFRRLRRSPSLLACASLDDDSTTYACGQCRAGVQHLGRLPP